LPNRIDYGISGFHVANFFRTSSEGLFRFRNYGLGLNISRPFNKFSRFDFSLVWYNVNLEYLEFDIPDQLITTILPKISYVRDQVRWGMTGPMDGSRSVISATFSPKYADDALDFQTYKVDFRKYLPIAKYYSFAFRLSAGTSRGNNPQSFFLGGVNNWFNRSFNGSIRIENIEDVFFSEFVTPLRGARFYEQVGHNFVLANLEFRFPLIPYMQLGFPPITLGNIQGAFFTDIGSAWNDTRNWKGVHKDAGGSTIMKDLISGYGMGARIYIFGMLLRWDVAWRYDIKTVSKPKYYWSVGVDF
jgi:outer membrane protein assembly factor BamA